MIPEQTSLTIDALHAGVYILRDTGNGLTRENRDANAAGVGCGGGGAEWGGWERRGCHTCEGATPVHRRMTDR